MIGLKSISYCLFILFCSIQIFGQSYQIFQEKDTSVYSTYLKTEYQGFREVYRGLKVDSVKSDGFGTSYFFPKTVNRADSNNDFCGRIGYFFLGPKLLVSLSGEQYLFDVLGRPIRLIPKVSVGDSWIIQKLNDSIFLSGKRLVDSSFIFRSTKDSILRIQLALVNLSGNLIPDKVNGFEVWVSKNFGIVRSINFYDLNYSEKYFKLFFRKAELAGHKKLGGVLPMTFGELHNYELGDEFHFAFHRKYVNPNHGGYVKYRILNKTINGNSITYARLRRFYLESESGNSEMSNRIDDFIVEDVNEYVHEVLPGCTFFSHGANNIHIMTRTDYGFFEVNEYLPFSQSSGDTCYRRRTFESGKRDTWTAGIGYSYYQYTGDGTFGELELVYFKKGAQEWGTAISIDEAEGNSSQDLKVYPNPANSFLVLDGDAFKIARLLDFRGRLIAEFKLNPSLINPRIELDNILPGSYILEVVSKDKTEATRVQVMK